MTNILSVCRKEFKSYFNSPIAYVYMTVFLILTIWLFFRSFFIVNQTTLRDYFGLVPLVFLFFVPAVTMRLWAEEKKIGTIELLMTLPIRDSEAVLGKFLASFLFLTITVALTFPLPIMVALLGDADPGPIVGGYLGVLLMGAAYLAIGLFISSLTENQIVAFILSITACFALFIVGEELVLYAVPDALVGFFRALGLGAHFDSIGRGVIDSRDIIYYLSVIGFFLFLNVRFVESHKWS